MSLLILNQGYQNAHFAAMIRYSETIAETIHALSSVDRFACMKDFSDALLMGGEL